MDVSVVQEIGGIRVLAHRSTAAGDHFQSTRALLNSRDRFVDEIIHRLPVHSRLRQTGESRVPRDHGSAWTR